MEQRVERLAEFFRQFLVVPGVRLERRVRFGGFILGRVVVGRVVVGRVVNVWRVVVGRFRVVSSRLIAGRIVGRQRVRDIVRRSFIRRFLRRVGQSIFEPVFRECLSLQSRRVVQPQVQRYGVQRYGVRQPFARVIARALKSRRRV